MRQIFYILAIFTFISCGQTGNQSDKISIDEKAKELNNRGVELAMTFDNDSILKAIELFDRATIIQPDYYLAYWNKFVYQNQLGLSKQAYITLQNLEKLKPENPDLKVTDGIFLELNGDSLAARKKFIEADKIYKTILDTLTENADPLQTILTNSAVNLKLLGQVNKGDQILKEISRKMTDENFKQMVDNFATMTRQELIENLKQMKE
jgi:tetratricopeptide (TPR) repeat protein